MTASWRAAQGRSIKHLYETAAEKVMHTYGQAGNYMENKKDHKRTNSVVSAYGRLPDRKSAIGFEGAVTPDWHEKKKVLITGAGSYIGETFRSYAKDHYADNFEFDTLDMKGAGWRDVDFGPYDVVFHVAGIAHADVGHADEKVKKNYYAVNTGLAIEAAEKAKADGAGLFVFMSSMIIYGDSAPYGKKRVIDAGTKPAPSNFYGDSKWQADKGIRSLADGDFKVCVLRPPMIYGRGSKGNYPMLSNLAQKLPAFPDINNQRSMLYIENLCEFLCQCMLVPRTVFSASGNIFFPQNAEYVKTSDMVKKISRAHGKKMVLTKLLNPAVFCASKLPGKCGELANKAFGNNCYEKRMSQYEGIHYQQIALEKSIKRTSFGREGNVKKKVLFLVNHDIVIYNFRLELVERLLRDGYEVHISSPYGERIEKLKALGCFYHETCMERHGMDPIKELKLIRTYKVLCKTIKPEVVLTYTIKPNIYGGMVCSRLGIPYIANITGLGTAIENAGIIKKITLSLYKKGLIKAQKVFFQNEENMKFMIKQGIVTCPYALLPGSGVNLKEYVYMEYPETSDPVIFVTIGRLMKDKGTDEILEAASIIKKRHAHVIFWLVGDYDEEAYKDKVGCAVKAGIVEYFGNQSDVRIFIKESHAIIHASYHEGMSNVLLESAACGRPILATDVPGCIETFIPGVSGIAFKAGNVKSLVNAIERFLEIPFGERRKMGQMGRKKMEAEFDREIIVEAYMDELQKAAGIEINKRRQEKESHA